MLRQGSRVAILGYGTIVQNCLSAAQLLQALDISITVADARFCKPLDGNLIRQLAQEHEVLITVEEGSIGGFSSHVSHYMGLNGLLDGNLKVIIILFLVHLIPICKIFMEDLCSVWILVSTRIWRERKRECYSESKMYISLFYSPISFSTPPHHEFVFWKTRR